MLIVSAYPLWLFVFARRFFKLVRCIIIDYVYFAFAILTNTKKLLPNFILLSFQLLE
jgi:hypothetical protein